MIKAFSGSELLIKSGGAKYPEHQYQQPGNRVRSFVDWKIKGSFWISGGFEMNYRNEFNSIEVLKDYNAWQQSGLAV